MAKNFKTLQAKMSPASRARSEAKAKELMAAMPLDELRAARDLTQEHLSTLLGISQAAISKLEHRTDMYVSTLGHFVKAMGGRLEIRAVFPEGCVQITQFEKLLGTVHAQLAGEATKKPEGKVAAPRRRLARQMA